jgi:starvation-inducible outer membrane lipoprotein
MRGALLALLVLALAACNTVPKVVEVKVPVAVGCLGDKQKRPEPKFGTGPYPGDKVAAQVALQDYAAMDGYATGLEVAMSGCDPKPTVKPQPAPSKLP